MLRTLNIRSVKALVALDPAAPAKVTGGYVIPAERSCIEPLPKRSRPGITVPRLPVIR